jgi:hypothetical protein
MSRVRRDICVLMFTEIEPATGARGGCGAGAGEAGYTRDHEDRVLAGRIDRHRPFSIDVFMA